LPGSAFWGLSLAPRLPRQGFPQRADLGFQLIEFAPKDGELGDSKSYGCSQEKAKQLVRACGQAESEDCADDG
jgi:hypothetical protein